MNGAWIVLILVWLGDWPWLWILVGWIWTAEWGRWPPSALPYGAVLGTVLVTEAVLALAGTRLPASRSSRRVGAEGAMFAWSAAHFGALPGFLLWQTTSGFDAAQRLHGLLRSWARQLPLRAVRFSVGLAVLWYLATVR